jgi:hypothetical protein
MLILGTAAFRFGLADRAQADDVLAVTHTMLNGTGISRHHVFDNSFRSRSQ